MGRGTGKEREPSGAWRWKTAGSGVWEVGRGRDEWRGSEGLSGALACKAINVNHN